MGGDGVKERGYGSFCRGGGKDQSFRVMPRGFPSRLVDANVFFVSGRSLVRDGLVEVRRSCAMLIYSRRQVGPFAAQRKQDSVGGILRALFRGPRPLLGFQDVQSP